MTMATLRKTIQLLLIEDNKADARLVEEFLADCEDLEADLTHASSLEEGLSALDGETFDLVLLDLNLPDSQGYDTCRRVRQEFPELPIVVLSGKDDVSLAVRAVQEGSQDYVYKGRLDPFQLERTIRHSLERANRVEEVRQNEERLALAVRGANDGLWDWDLVSNSIFFSPRWKAMLGYGDGEIGRTPEDWLRFVHPEDLGEVRAAIERHLMGRSEDLSIECRMEHKTGIYRWMLVRGRAVFSKGQARRMAGSMTDITEKKLTEEQLKHDAFYDTLTGTPNRALFMERLELAVGRAQKQTDYRFAVLFVDLDYFKEVNDTMGHDAGDRLLKEMTRRLETCVRPADTVARMGGDEFAILLDDLTSRDQASTIAARILDEVQRPFSVKETEIVISLTIGVALNRPDHHAATDVLRDADAAMYQGKERGRGCFELFAEEMRTDAPAHWEVERDLEAALENGDLRLHYQPIVELSTGRFRGFEALLRWAHPERGWLMPLDFLDVAERTGLIIPIGEWVLREACTTLNRWNTRYGDPESPWFVTVNLSSRQFHAPDLVSQIESVLLETGLRSQQLKLEVTEGVAMEQVDSATARFLNLRAQQIGLFLDNFGAGNSSLACLHRFPIETLKVDRSFVRAIGTQARKKKLVDTLLLLAENLDMNLVAEGIETPDERATLEAIGCRLGQGNLFCRPCGPGAIEELLQNR